MNYEQIIVERLGLVPELGSSSFLPRLVGAGRALELGEEIADRPLDAVQLIRALLRDNAHEPDFREATGREGEALRLAYASPQHHEAVKAFLEKRRPNFTAMRTRMPDCAG